MRDYIREWGLESVPSLHHGGQARPRKTKSETLLNKGVVWLTPPSSGVRPMPVWLSKPVSWMYPGVFINWLFSRCVIKKNRTANVGKRTQQWEFLGERHEYHDQAWSSKPQPQLRRYRWWNRAADHPKYRSLSSTIRECGLVNIRALENPRTFNRVNEHGLALRIRPFLKMDMKIRVSSVLSASIRNTDRGRIADIVTWLGSSSAWERIDLFWLRLKACSARQVIRSQHDEYIQDWGTKRYTG